ncbi:MAG: hypothetical protein WAV09_03055 [Minisyncoccia bacterium]
MSEVEWKTQAAREAQEIYDAWEQDADGMDDEYGGGGICDNIAGALADALTAAGIDAFTFHYENENHTVAIAMIAGGTVEVDIPLQLYERGSYYSYTKVKGFKFGPEHIFLTPLGGPEVFEELGEG